MFTPTLLRRNVLHTIRAARSPRLPLPHLTRPRTLNSPWLRRHIQQQRGESTAAKQARQSPYKYPESIIVYQAPFVSTALHCLTRAACLVAIPVGLLLARVHYLDPTTPNWTVPALILGSTLPFLLIATTHGPTILQITLHLPNSARRSRETLFAFASSAVPPNTLLTMKFIRFAPWPKTWFYHYSDLRRLPLIKYPLSNLEHIPHGKVEAYGYGWRGWAGRTWFGRYWINMGSATRDRSQVPGVWDAVWKGMEFARDEGEGVGKRLGRVGERGGGERKAGVMRNREGSGLQRHRVVAVAPGSALKGARGPSTARSAQKRP